MLDCRKKKTVQKSLHPSCVALSPTCLSTFEHCVFMWKCTILHRLLSSFPLHEDDDDEEESGVVSNLVLLIVK